MIMIPKIITQVDHDKSIMEPRSSIMVRGMITTRPVDHGQVRSAIPDRTPARYPRRAAPLPAIPPMPAWRAPCASARTNGETTVTTPTANPAEDARVIALRLIDRINRITAYGRINTHHAYDAQKALSDAEDALAELDPDTWDEDDD